MLPIMVPGIKVSRAVQDPVRCQKEAPVAQIMHHLHGDR